jgi:AcrR family transcriptional regulator
MVAMGSPLRSRLALDERRAQLLELGLRLFGTRSYDEVAIDDIAAEAGVSKGLLYHYFGSKRAFYVATVQHAAQTLVDALMAADHGQPGPERARAGITAYIDFVDERAEAYAALVSSGLGADPEVTAIVQGTREAIITSILVDLGLHEPRPVFQLALRTFIGGVEAAALDWIARRHVTRDALVEFLAGLLERTLHLAVELDPDAGVEL